MHHCKQIQKCCHLLHKLEFHPHNNLILNNEPIPWGTSYKYLGMHLDSKLMWQKHMMKFLDKIEKAIFNFDFILAYKSCLSLKNKLLLYKSYIRPILTYGSVIYGSTAKICLQRIQIFQNKQSHRFTKAFRYIHNDVIHSDLHIRKFFDEIRHLVIKFHRCLLLVRNPILKNVLAYDPNVR